MGNSEVASILRASQTMGNPQREKWTLPLSTDQEFGPQGGLGAKYTVLKVKDLIGIKLWSANEDASVGADF